MSPLTDNSALITIDVSRSGDVLLDDVETYDGRRERIRTVRCCGWELIHIADPEQDLPRHQVREEGRRRRNQRMVGEEVPDGGPEGPGGHCRRRREREEVVQICRNSPLHPLLRSLVHHHHGGA